MKIIGLSGLLLFLSPGQINGRLLATKVQDRQLEDDMEEGCNLPDNLATGTLHDRLTEAYLYFEREANFSDFVEEFDDAGNNRVRARLCQDLLETPASKTLSCLAQDMHTTIELDASKAVTFLFTTFEVGVSLFFGEEGQLACGIDRGLGGALEFVGAGLASGVSIRSDEGWDTVAERPWICLSAGWEYFVGFAATMMFDPLVLPANVAVDLLRDTLVFYDLQDDDVLFVDEVLGRAMNGLLGTEDGVVAVGVEATAGLEAKNVVPIVFGVIPDISITACAETLLYCSKDCGGKLME